jgi:hypothetical protein
LVSGKSLFRGVMKRRFLGFRKIAFSGLHEKAFYLFPKNSLFR